MFGINYVKADPSTFIMQIRNGTVVREGIGKAFYYFAPSSSLVSVPVNSKELPFVFRVQTKDYQEVSIQGQVTFLISEPKAAAKTLNFAISPKGKYLAEDPDKVDERVIRSIQVSVRNHIEARDLRQALNCAQELTTELEQDLNGNKALNSLGIDINDISLTAIKPTPETGKALEAEVRESLLKEADTAIYARRLASIEQEKSVKESELETEKALQKKQQDLEKGMLEAEREQMQQRFLLKQEEIEAKIADEEKMKEWVALNATNERSRAEVEAYSISARLEAYNGIDTERLKVLSMAGLGPEQIIAQAIENLTQGENKVGNLNLTPDLLQSLMK